MDEEVDDEWEYEYDENETEDFYIPIDLSNVPSAQVPLNLERRQGHPTLLKSRLRALHASRGQLPDTTIESTSTQETATMGEVQISGLHTSNPLLMYNGQLLSCHWTSTIGTDMFFTKPLPELGDMHQPLRSLPSVDLLSLGPAKLVAKVGRLRPRDDLFETEGDVQATTAPHDNQSTSTNPRPAPTNFINRLNEAKARRGETTRLAVTQTSEGSRLISEPTNEPVQSGEDGILHAAGDILMGGT
jgi:hypothetical protein